jgi:hypothetical protein
MERNNGDVNSTATVDPPRTTDYLDGRLGGLLSRLERATAITHSLAQVLETATAGSFDPQKSEVVAEMVAPLVRQAEIAVGLAETASGTHWELEDWHCRRRRARADKAAAAKMARKHKAVAK